MTPPTLHPFQVVGARFLAERRGALLADAMRLGKTGQAIEACRMVGAKRVLVVCPAIARTHWHRDWAQWWPDGPAPVVWSYDEARRHRNGAPPPGDRIDALILDEVHYCKNPTASRTRAVLGKGGLVHYARRTWCLSGTPAPNHAGELWPLLRAFGLTALGYWAFVERYCRMDPWGGIKGTRKDTLPELRERMAPILLRRTKAEVAPELPAAEVTPWYVDGQVPALSGLSEEAQAILAALEGVPSEERGAFLERHARHLAQLRIWTAMAKVPMVAGAICDEMEAGEYDRLVVFGYHREPMAALQEALFQADIYGLSIHGGTSRSARDYALDAFASPAEQPRVLLAQTIAAGTAIDLSAAHQGILLERDWVPGNNAQAIERMGGWKQTQPVTVRDAVLPGSIDETVAAVVTRKTNELLGLLSHEGRP